MKGVPRTFGKKGQVTMFVIIALMIVVAGVLIYLFFPGIKTTSTTLQENPIAYFQNCIQGNLTADVRTISLQGGSMNPSPSITYNGSNIAYLCYNNQPYAYSTTEMCAPQVAFLTSSVEKQIEQAIAPTVHTCFQEMQKDYQSQGYTVTMNEGSFSVRLLSQKISLVSDTQLTLTKGEKEYYNSFDATLNNNLYELTGVASTIEGWEQTYGDADPVYFMGYYPDLRITKTVLSDWTHIWTIEEISTGNKFEFATRAINWPLGIPTPANQTSQ